jgi:hypothetical protein
MKVGNSFSVKQKDEKTLDQIKKSLYYSVRNFQKKNPNNAHMEFKIAIIIPNNEVRVWRTT